MKAVPAKMLVSFIGVLLVAPFFAVALIVGARAVALSQGVQDDLLLVVLALGSAAASIFSNMSRRQAQEKQAVSNVEARTKASARRASMIHLGY